MKTRNFSVEEIAHRPLPPALLPVGISLLGYAQGMRDMACATFGKEISITTTSGYRDKLYNRTVSTAKNPDNSNHIWRIVNGMPIGAWDFVPNGISLGVFWDWFKTKVTGERYLNRRKGFIHWAPNAPNKAPWVEG